MLQAINPMWLLLILGSLLLILGCSLFYLTRSPSISHTPAIAATSTQTPQWMTEMGILTSPLPLTTTTPRSRRSPTNSPPPDQRPPQCYIRPAGGYVCLGEVLNNTENVWENVQVRVNLYDRDSYLIATQIIALEQRRIAAQSTAPYHVSFTDTVQEPSSTRTLLYRKQRVDDAPSNLSIAEERGVLAENGRYILTARIANQNPSALRDIRAIVTLFDENDTVIGYRIHPVTNSLASDETATIRVEIIPIIQSDDISHRLVLDYR